MIVPNRLQRQCPSLPGSDTRNEKCTASLAGSTRLNRSPGNRRNRKDGPSKGVKRSAGLVGTDFAWGEFCGPRRCHPCADSKRSTHYREVTDASSVRILSRLPYLRPTPPRSHRVRWIKSVVPTLPSRVRGPPPRSDVPPGRQKNSVDEAGRRVADACCPVT